MPTSPTWGDIFRDICAGLHPDENLPVLGIATANGGDALEVIDDLNYRIGTADADALENAWIHVDSFVGAGPAVGEFSSINDAGLAIGTGTISFTPAFTQILEDTAKFSIWRKIDPLTALRNMNRVARILKREQLVPITLITDGDLEGTAPETAIFDVNSGGPPTLTLETTEFHRGSQAVLIAHDGNGVWVVDLDQEVPVIETQHYLLSLWIFPSTAAATGDGIQVALVEEGTGVAIGDTGQHNEFMYQEINLEDLHIPTGIKLVNVHISSLGVQDSTYVDGVHLWNRDQGWWDLPSWVEDPADVLEIGYFRRGRNLSGNNAYTVDEREWVPWPFRRDQFVEESGSQPLRIRFDTPVTRPLFARIKRRWPVISGTTFGDSTTVDRDLFRDLTLVHIYTELEVAAGERGDTAAVSAYAKARSTYESLESIQRFNSRFGKLIPHVNFPSRRR
jgi:hypothetical protein